MSCEKHGYFTKTEARTRLNEIAIEKARDKTPVRAYLCPECGLYHLTSMSKRVAKKNGSTHKR